MPDLQLPMQNRADSSTIKSKSTKREGHPSCTVYYLLYIKHNANAELGQDDVEFCKTDVAEHGVGLGVVWPSIGEFDAMVTGEVGSYSRFIGGADVGCMSTNEDDLWVNADCGQSTRHSVCVKRNCLEPNE